MANKKIEIGDKVRLITGGNPMTVTGVSNHESKIQCSIWSNQEERYVVITNLDVRCVEVIS